MPRPDGHPAGLAGALVGGLHGARPAAGDDGVAGLGQQPADLDGEGVLGAVPRDPGRPEHADRAPQLGQRAEALDELRLDAQHPPRVGVDPVARPARVEQPLVGGAGLDLVAAQRDRSLVDLRAVAVVGARALGRAELQSHAGEAIRRRRAGPPSVSCSKTSRRAVTWSSSSWSNIASRTAATCPGAAATRAARPASVSTASAPRRSVGCRSRRTQPRSSRRATACESRLGDELVMRASSLIRSVRSGASESMASTM